MPDQRLEQPNPSNTTRRKVVFGLLALLFLVPFVAALWYWQAGPRRTIRVTGGLALSVAFSPDGRTLATGDADGYVRLWDAGTGEPRLAWRAEGWVYDLAFSEDGEVLGATVRRAAGGRLGGRERRSWRAGTGEELRGGGEAPPQAAPLMSPDGAVAARVVGNTIVLSDARTGARRLTLEGHPDAVNCMAFSPDGLTLATGGGSLAGSGPHPLPWLNGDLRLWDVSSGTLLSRHNRHSQPILGVAFSPDGRTVASASYDGTVKLWAVSER